MVRLLTAVFLFASLNSVADDLRTFSDGQVINADDFNHNFQKLEQDIADIPAGPKGDKGDKGDTGEQGLPGLDGADGQDGVNPFENLNCNQGDTLTFRNGGWECAPHEAVVTAFITFNDWQDEGPDGQWTDREWRSLSELDTTVSSNVDALNSACYKGWVSSLGPEYGFETSCNFNVSGDFYPDGCAMRASRDGSVSLYRESGALALDGFEDLADGQSFTIDILCYSGLFAP